MIPDATVFTVTRKQIAGAVMAILLPALSWSGVDYIHTRDIARNTQAQTEQLQADVRETRQDILRILVMMNRQFTGDTEEIARLTAELNAIKAKEVKQ